MSDKEDKLAAVRQQFLSGLQDKAQALEVMLASTKEGSVEQPIAALLHKIAGSAGFYGQREIAELARVLEIRLLETSLTEDITRDLVALIMVMRGTVE